MRSRACVGLFKPSLPRNVGGKLKNALVVNVVQHRLASPRAVLTKRGLAFYIGSSPGAPQCARDRRTRGKSTGVKISVVHSGVRA